jgi:hypothetical protein
MAQQTGKLHVDVKWWVLEFTRLLSSVLKIQRFATTGITPWQTALKVHCGLPSPALIQPGQAWAILSQISTPECGNPHYGFCINSNTLSKRPRLPRSAVRI